MYDVEIPDQQNASNSKDNVTHLISHLKPFTLYAFYVKTYTIATETNGAMSEIQYFTTSPAGRLTTNDDEFRQELKKVLKINDCCLVCSTYSAETAEKCGTFGFASRVGLAATRNDQW